METGGLDVSGFLSGVQTSLLSGVNDSLPIAGVVLAAVAGLFMAVKIFKRITGART